jgi:adenylate kinase
MRISLSGTPGTGKTSLALAFDPTRFTIIPMNDLSENYTTGRDEERESTEVDVDRMASDIADGTLVLPTGEDSKDHLIIEGHMAHHLPLDIIIVLRTSTKTLRARLSDRGYQEEKVMENMEAEAMGLITLEAFDTTRPLYEINTTDITPNEVMTRCEEIIRGESEPLGDLADMIDFTEEILEWY